MTSIRPPTPEELRERERVERLIREQIRGTLGNEGRAADKRIAKIGRFSNTFRDKAFKSGKFKAAAEYAQQMARFNAMPRHFKERAYPPRPSQEAAQQMNTIRQRTNTAIRRDMKTDLAAIDKFQKRHRQYEHDLRLKHDKHYRPNRGGGIFSFVRRPEDREGFRTWSAQHDPEFHKRQQRFLKKYGEDPQKYRSLIPGLGGRGDLREEAAFSRQFINRAEYDKARNDAWNRYNQWKRKQPRTPYKPRSPWLTPRVMNKPIIDIMGEQATGQAPFVGPRPKRPNMVVEKFGPAYKAAVQKQFDDAARKNAEKQLKVQTDKQLKSFYNQLGTPVPRPKQPKPKVGPITRTTTKRPSTPTQGAIPSPYADMIKYEQDKLWAKYRKDQAQAQTPAPRKKPRYNQAPYLAGLQSAPMTMGQKMKPQQGIYKPYANGGGVRKPKYNKKG